MDDESTRIVCRLAVVSHSISPASQPEGRTLRE